MRTYVLKDYFDPATTRQLKVLSFFDVKTDPAPSKGRASGIIASLFSKPANKHLWTAYAYTTGDEDDSIVELLPHDRAALAQVVVPDNWRSPRHPVVSSEKRKAIEVMVSNLLKEGSPFDDELAEISIAGKCFAFTRRFEFGSRNDCQKAVIARGGSISNGVTSKTDVLVIGSDANPAWSHGTYGNKIEAAMLSRMHNGKPAIIPEALWKELLQP
jgi:hypothetical protein